MATGGLFDRYMRPQNWTRPHRELQKVAATAQNDEPKQTNKKRNEMKWKPLPIKTSVAVRRQTSGHCRLVLDKVISRGTVLIHSYQLQLIFKTRCLICTPTQTNASSCKILEPRIKHARRGRTRE